MSFKIDWKDAGREPQCAPNPAFPNGIDIDAAVGAAEASRFDFQNVNYEWYVEAAKKLVIG